jgi:hypothetical protein
MTASQQPPDRLTRTVRRLLAELCWIRYEQNVLRHLKGLDHVGVDFFLVTHTGLRGDRLIRLVRIFEESERVASFWYLLRCRPKHVEGLLSDAGVKLSDVQDLSNRLKIVRNAVFVHIDKRGVFDPPAIYKAAGLTGRRIEKVVDCLWSALQRFYEELSGSQYNADDYNARDVRPLHRLYMTSRTRKARRHGRSI